MRYNVPALFEVENIEVTRFETPDYEAEVRYFPREHRIEVESDITKGLQEGEEIEKLLEEDMNLHLEPEEYGDVAYEYVEVFLEKGTGVELLDDVGDTVLRLV